VQKEVGTKADNGWGLYDVVGLSGEWALDTAANLNTIPASGLPSCSVDPTGASGFQSRILKSASGNWYKTAIYDLLPSRRQMLQPSNDGCSTRFCIHLKPLGSLTFEGL